jgi:toxin YoeB
MRLAFTPDGWDDYTYWQTADRQVLKRINKLITETMRDPFDGIGQPEQLRHHVAAAWSRRIDKEHRLVCLVEDDDLIIVQARFHY